MCAAVVKEDAMPRITVAGGPSNAAALPGQAGHMAPADAGALGDEAAGDAPGLVEIQPEPEPAAEAVPVAPDYGSMTPAALREEAKSRGLPVSGSKADLAARLAHADEATLPAEAQAALAAGGD